MFTDLPDRLGMTTVLWHPSFFFTFNFLLSITDIFEVYHGFSISMQREPTNPSPIDVNTVRRVQLAVVSALRNLVVAPQNKRTAAAGGRAMPLALKALPSVEDHHIAYKLLALIRMLVDGQG